MKKRCLLITMLMLFAVSVQAVAADNMPIGTLPRRRIRALTVESNNGSASCRDGVLQMGRTAAGGTNPRFKFSFRQGLWANGRRFRTGNGYENHGGFVSDVFSKFSAGGEYFPGEPDERDAA